MREERTEKCDELQTATQVWYGRVDDILSSVTFADRWLSPDEVARRNRYKFDRDRHSFTAGRILLKEVLSRYLNEAPCRVLIVPNEKGAIYVPPPQNPAGVHVNLSRRRQIVTCIVSPKRCGVDVEDTKRRVDVDELAKNVMSDAERDVLTRLTGADRTDYFFTLWCLKEAYLKALGQGFHIAPSRVSFSLNHPGGPRVSLEGPMPTDVNVSPTDFGFVLRRPDTDHLLVGAHDVSGPPSGFQVRCFSGVPTERSV